MPPNLRPLLPLAVNARFVDELLCADAPCCGLGLVEEQQRTRGFLALRLDEVIPEEVEAAGFRLGHQLLGNDEFVVARFSFEFYGFKTWHMLVNPSSPVVQRVLSTMLQSADYFFFVINVEGSATLFRSEIGEEDLAGLKVNLPRMRHATTTDPQYQKALAAFSREMGPHTILNWVCGRNEDYLDLSTNRSELNPRP